MKIFYFLLLTLFSQLALAQTEFITRWNLATPGSGDTQLSFRVGTSGTVSYTWQEVSPGTASGSGTFTGTTATIQSLPSGAVIDLSISPTNFTRILILNGTDKDRLIDVSQWGTTTWTTMFQAFYGCSNLQISATDLPNLSEVYDLVAMFHGCTALNGPANIGEWNTENVTNLRFMFYEASAFNQPVGTWNTANVVSMSNMFYSAGAFNQPIEGWNTANVTDMSYLFYSASAFNQPIEAWDTGNVNNMKSMFSRTDAFNQPIDNWNVSKVTNMTYMFSNTASFNKPLGSWNTGSVTNMFGMFSYASAFNQPIGSWNTEKVTDMTYMFLGASAFNQPIGAWNTANVTSMGSMFSSASAFNQPIGNWNTGNVTDMSFMFGVASTFNEYLGRWILNASVDLTFMFTNSGLDCDHYSATLMGWSANPSTPNGLSLGATGRSYGTSAVAARNNLVTTKGWTITGDAASDSDCSGALYFVTRWNLATSGSVATQISFGVGTSGTVSYTWQEVSPGTASGSGTFTGTTATIEGLPEGSVIDLKIHPINFNGFTIYGRPDRNRLVDVRQWGTASWVSMAGAFYGCSNLRISAIDYPDLSRVASMKGMFRSCNVLNGPANIGHWNTTNVTDMGYLFASAPAFNQDISNWNTGNVTKMDFMFSGAGLFNQPIGSWNTAKVTTMASMFYDAYSFDQPIDSQGNDIWNTANVTDMSYMFAIASSFNQPIGSWDTGKVTDMSYMFYTTNTFDQPIGSWDTRSVINMSFMFDDARSFDQPIGDWETGNVTDMSSMFERTRTFNQPIDDWDTGKVTNMSDMFNQNEAFNQPIGSWDTGNVTDVSAMFAYNNTFNQPIGDWDTGNVTDMISMFAYNNAFNQPIDDWDTGKVLYMGTMFAYNNAFNQPIGNWNVAEVRSMNHMFSSATSFNQSIGTWTLHAGVNIQHMLNLTGMDCYHYSETLKGWSNNPNTPSGRVLGAEGTAYGTSAVTARSNLTGTKGWTIVNDAASVAACSSPLPVTLISFSGIKTAENQNMLKWITDDEKDFDRFEIQRAFDARGFETIGNVFGQGVEGAGTLHSYTFTDPLPGTSNYYRLKMIDVDESFEYSRIISIANSTEHSVVGSFYPNPSSGKVFVDVYAVESGSWTLTITDATGRAVSTQVQNLQSGINKIAVNRLSTGLNLVRFEHGPISEVRKLIRE